MPVGKMIAMFQVETKRKTSVLQYWGFFLSIMGQDPRLGCTLFMPV